MPIVLIKGISHYGVIIYKGEDPKRKKVVNFAKVIKGEELTRIAEKVVA